MNYILQLQQENEEKKNIIMRVDDAICEFMGHLHSSKFNCGDKLDQYINISDVSNRLMQMRNELYPD